MSNSYFDFDYVDRINIYITEDVYDILLYDMDIFNVSRKKNGELNKNDFITKIIVNYSDKYRKYYDHKLEAYKNTLKEVIDNKKVDYDLLITKLLNSINSVDNKDSQIKDITIAYRPQRKNIALMNELNKISDFLLKHNEINPSAYFRNLLQEYCSLAQCKREEIIFKDIYDQLTSAINNKKHISFKFDGYGGKYKIGCCPYALVTNKEKKTNYLIAYSDGVDNSGNTIPEEKRIITRKISNISNIIFDEQKYSIKNEIKNKLDIRKKQKDMIEELEYDVYVLFNHNGYNKYRNITTLRPTGVEIKDISTLDKKVIKEINKINKTLKDYDRLYYFKDNSFKIKNYFIRLGKDAIIVSPEEIKKDITSYYQEASDIYKSIN